MISNQGVTVSPPAMSDTVTPYSSINIQLHLQTP